MGRATHAPGEAAGLTGGAYPHLRQIVVTRREVPQASGLEVMAGDVAAQVAKIKSAPGADIWLCGGAQLAGQLIDLIDEIQLKVNPVLLGEGIPLFSGGVGARSVRAVALESLPGGVNLATYRTD